MSIQSIRCALPCCCKNQETQTTCSLIGRIIIVVAGVLALTVGALILTGVLHGRDPIIGGVLIGGGSLLLLIGVCIKSVRQSSLPQSLLDLLKKITPSNYAEYLDLDHPPETSSLQKNDFGFSRCDTVSHPRLVVTFTLNRCHDYDYLQIQGGQFVHVRTKGEQSSFSNLEEFFHYFRQGNFGFSKEEAKKITSINLVNLKRRND